MAKILKKSHNCTWEFINDDQMGSIISCNCCSYFFFFFNFFIIVKWHRKLFYLPIPFLALFAHFTSLAQCTYKQYNSLTHPNIVNVNQIVFFFSCPKKMYTKLVVAIWHPLRYIWGLNTNCKIVCLFEMQQQLLPLGASIKIWKSTSQPHFLFLQPKSRSLRPPT